MTERVALRLDSVIPGVISDVGSAHARLARIAAALEGFDGVTFALHIIARPDPVHATPGTIDVGVVASGDFRGEDVTDDLLDLLAGPPRAWVLEESDPAEFEANEFATPENVVEIVRRVESCPLPSGFGTAGYAREAGHSRENPHLWSMWSFATPEFSWRTVFSALLDHEAPVRIRVSLTSTSLTSAERDELEDLVERFESATPREGILRASLTSLQRFLYLRPLFETHISIESPEPLPPSLVSTIGWSVSMQPSRQDRDGRLTGGYQILGRDAVTATEPFGRALARLRHLFDPWEAAAAFRLPVAYGGSIKGVREVRVPILDASPEGIESSGTLLGTTAATGRPIKVHLSEHQRLRHLYLVGQTGTGKSTLIANLALQDIESGAGVAVIDPHGDLVSDLLERIPEDRRDDVVLINPADPDAVVGVNLIEAESEAAGQFIVAELCEMFYELYDPGRTGIVGPRYESWLRNAASLLISNRGHPSSFLDIATVFVDKAVQRYLVDHADDPLILEFWRGEMARTSNYHLSEVLGWFRSKFEPFRAPFVRRVVGQARSSVSFSEVMDESKILLVNLSKALLGEYNSRLIGFVTLTRLWSAALLRGAQPPGSRHPFYLYVDEFHSVVTPSLPDMLSEARKFGIGVTLANQFFHQVPEKVRASLLGNVGTRVAFRLGPEDAANLPPWFGSGVSAHDFRTLPEHHAIVALSNRGVPLDPVVISTEPLEPGDPTSPEAIRHLSNRRWARPVADIDNEIRTRWSDVEGSLTAGQVEEKGEPDVLSLDQWLTQARKRSAPNDDSEAEEDGGLETDQLPLSIPGEPPDPADLDS